MNKKTLKSSQGRDNITLLAIGIIIAISLFGCKGENKRNVVQQPPQTTASKSAAPAATPATSPAATQQQKEAGKHQAEEPKKDTSKGKSDPSAPPSKAAVKKEAPVEGPAKTEEMAEEEKAEYVYDPTGKRDPFRSAILGESLMGKEALPPLQRREVSELKLIGIIWGASGYNAMLETPDGKGYTVKVGTLIGPKKGVVKRITKKTIVIEEKYMDIIGEIKTREIIMELPSKEEVLE